MNPLQELIHRRMAERDWSYSDVARRGSLPRSTVHHLAKNERPARSPHPQTLTRLAEGLDLPAALVRSAAARAAGCEAPEHDVAAYPATRDATDGYDADDLEAHHIVWALRQLSHEDRRQVAVLVRALLERRGPRAGERTPAH